MKEIRCESEYIYFEFLFTGLTQPSQGLLPQSTQSAPTLLAQLTAALSRPQIYGDERDGIIAKFNQLQACWGTGKGFYNQQGAVDFSPQNPFCRFKVSSCLLRRVRKVHVKMMTVAFTVQGRA